MPSKPPVHHRLVQARNTSSAGPTIKHATSRNGTRRRGRTRPESASLLPSRYARLAAPGVIEWARTVHDWNCILPHIGKPPRRLFNLTTNRTTMDEYGWWLFYISETAMRSSAWTHRGEPSLDVRIDCFMTKRVIHAVRRTRKKSCQKFGSEPAGSVPTGDYPINRRSEKRQNEPLATFYLERFVFRPFVCLRGTGPSSSHC
jgi:hypothetical protein